MLLPYHQYFSTVHGSEIQKNIFCIDCCDPAIIVALW